MRQLVHRVVAVTVALASFVDLVKARGEALARTTVGASADKEIPARRASIVLTSGQVHGRNQLCRRSRRFPSFFAAAWACRAAA